METKAHIGSVGISQTHCVQINFKTERLESYFPFRTAEERAGRYNKIRFIFHK